MKNFLVRYWRDPFVWLSFGFFITTFFFIAKQVWELGLTDILLTVPNTFFYSVFGLLFLLWVYFSGWRGSELLFSLNHLSRSLILLLPTTLLFVFGISFSKEFHFIFQIGPGILIILTFGLIFYRYIRNKKRLPSEKITPKEWLRKQGIPALFAVLFFTGLFCSFATYKLGQYAAVDEPLWLYGRIPKFWNNVQEREWQKTDVSDKPGITVAITSGVGLLRYDPRHFDDNRREGEVFVEKNVAEMESFFFTFRFPIVVLVTILLLGVYFLLERLLGKETALVSYASLTTSPILIGIAKIINPDALLWLFTTLSLLCYLVFQKKSLYRYLVLAGIFLGLGLLTKYIANIIFIYLFLLLFLEYIYHKEQSQKLLSEYIREGLIHIALIIFTALTTFYVLLPANWPEPKELIESTLLSQAFVRVAPLFGLLVAILIADQIFNKNRLASLVVHITSMSKVWLARILALIFLGSIVFTLLNTWYGMYFYDFMDLISSPKTIERNSDFVGVFLTNFYPLIFSLTPLVLIGLIAATCFPLFKKDFFQNDLYRFALYVIVFTLVYYLGAAVNGVGSIIRYQIIIFPLIALMAGVGISALVALLQKRFPVRQAFFLPLALLIIAGTSIYTLVKTPFPLSYASSLLPHQYYVDLKDMGPGSYEIAMLLNQLPDASNILVWTDKDGVCQFFIGRCKRGNGKEAITDQSIDYIVISSARESRSNNMVRSRYEDDPQHVIPIHLFYEKTEPADFSIFINNNPAHYVKAFRYQGQKEVAE